MPAKVGSGADVFLFGFKKFQGLLDWTGEFEVRQIGDGFSFALSDVSVNPGSILASLCHRLHVCLIRNCVPSDPTPVAVSLSPALPPGH